MQGVVGADRSTNTQAKLLAEVKPTYRKQGSVIVSAARAPWAGWHAHGNHCKAAWRSVQSCAHWLQRRTWAAPCTSHTASLNFALSILTLLNLLVQVVGIAAVRAGGREMAGWCIGPADDLRLCKQCDAGRLLTFRVSAAQLRSATHRSIVLPQPAALPTSLASTASACGHSNRVWS